MLAEYRAFLPDEKIWPEGLVGKPEKGRDRVADLEVCFLMIRACSGGCAGYAANARPEQFIDRFPLERITFDPRYRPKWLE